VIPGVEDEDAPFTIATVPLAVYGAMFGATVAGQLLGIALDALVLHARWLWVPAAGSVVLEAIVAARWGARATPPLGAGRAWRLSACYSLLLGGLSLPLLGWAAAARAAPGRGLTPEVLGSIAWSLGAVAAALLAATLARGALLVALLRRTAP